jgi:hypothetical protein
MSIIAIKNSANAAAKGSEVHQSFLLTDKEIKYKNNSAPLMSLGIITSLAAKFLCCQKLSQMSEKIDSLKKIICNHDCSRGKI